MDLEGYFEKTEGLGILATASSRGNVDVANRSRPHVIDEQTIAWIMSDRPSRANLQSNPIAAMSHCSRRLLGDLCRATLRLLTRYQEIPMAASPSREAIAPELPPLRFR